MAVANLKIGNKYKIFIPASCHKHLSFYVKPGTFYTTRNLHEKVVEVIDIEEKYLGIKVRYGKDFLYEPIIAWIDETWLFTIDPDGKCICETKLLMTQGCKCGGS